MGRPKKIRTPEEEAAYRESLRAAKRKHAHRRRADPAERAKEAAAKRRRRAEDPEYAQREKAKDRERKRILRKADPDFRAAENKQRRAHSLRRKSAAEGTSAVRRSRPKAADIALRLWEELQARRSETAPRLE